MNMRALAILLTLASNAAWADPAIVVVVSASSPVDKLTQNDISSIFLDKALFFPNGKPAEPFNYAPESKLNDWRVGFEQLVLNKNPTQVKAYWSRLLFTGAGKLPKEIKSAEELKEIFKSNPSAIGYVDKSAVDGSMKIVYQP